MAHAVDQSTDAEASSARSASPPSSPFEISVPSDLRVNEHDDCTMAGSLQEDEEDSNLSQAKGSALQSRQLFRSEEYRQLFHLPPEEVLVQDFNCALQEKILLQGHMYVFEHNVCFYSNIFGYERKKVIKLVDVTCVRKAKTAGLFPNAIEIVAWGKKNFFSSFLSRDEAFRLIVDGWCRHSRNARLFLGSQSASKQSDNFSTSFLSSQLLQDQQGLSLMESSFGSRNDGEIPFDSVHLNTEAIVLGTAGELDHIEVDTAMGSNADTSSRNISDWDVEEEDAPKLPEHYKLIAESELPVDVHDFFRLFYSNDAIGFYEAFHRKCGDEDLQCTQWAKHRHFGHVRDVSFRHRINYYFGPKATYCQEVQRYRVYKNNHLIIETSQQMNDIPYGDHFRVEGRWDVERLCNRDRNYCFVRIFMFVPFSKKTVWKGKIEQGTFDECKEAYSAWIMEAHKLLQDNGIINDRNLSDEPVSPILVQPNNYALATPTRKQGNENTALSSLKTAQQKLEMENAGKLRDPCKVGNAKTFGNQSSKTPRVNRFGGTVEKVARGPSDSVPTSEQHPGFSMLDSKSLDRIKPTIITSILVIILLTQVVIMIALARSSRVQYIPAGCSLKSEEEYSRSCLRSSDREEAIASLEQRAEFLYEELVMAESRLQTLKRDLSQVKSRMQLLQKNKPQLDLNEEVVSSSI